MKKAARERENSARAALAEEEETRLVAGPAGGSGRDRHRHPANTPRRPTLVRVKRLRFCCGERGSIRPRSGTAGRPPAGGAARGNQPRSMILSGVTRHLAVTRRPRDPLKREACQRRAGVDPMPREPRWCADIRVFCGEYAARRGFRTCGSPRGFSAAPGGGAARLGRGGNTTAETQRV
jgi:hypothetical protein